MFGVGAGVLLLCVLVACDVSLVCVLLGLFRFVRFCDFVVRYVDCFVWGCVLLIVWCVCGALLRLCCGVTCVV